MEVDSVNFFTLCDVVLTHLGPNVSSHLCMYCLHVAAKCYGHFVGKSACFVYVCVWLLRAAFY